MLPIQYYFYFTGKFKRSRLKILKKEPGTNISFPSDFIHKITVQHTLDPKIAGIISPNSPPGSPAISRLRAIARKNFSVLTLFFMYQFLYYLTHFYLNCKLIQDFFILMRAGI